MGAPLRRAMQVVTAAAVLAACTPLASAATTKIWWADQSSGEIASANIDGSGAANLVVSPAAASPKGLAFDASSGRVFWFQRTGTPRTIGAADLDGANRTSITAADTADPWGITFDQYTRRLYYSDWDQGPRNRIFWVEPDGSSGATPNIAYQGSSARSPYLPSVDPSSNRLYWMNDESTASTIGWASLTGAPESGEIARQGGGGCASFFPYAYLVIPNRSEIVWFDYTNNKFWKTDMDGANCTFLTDAAGVTNGMALDPRTNRVFYFVGTTLSYFDLSNPSDTGTVSLAPYTPGSPQFPVIVTRPYVESITAAASGARLSCDAQWYPGIPAANFYSAPTGATRFAWTRDGEVLPGATAATLVAPSNGTYACVATASNVMGETSVASNAITLGDVPAAPTPEAAKKDDPTKGAPVLRIASISVSRDRDIVTRAAVDSPVRIMQRGTFRSARARSATACRTTPRTMPAAGSTTLTCRVTPRLRAILRVRSVTVRVRTTVVRTAGQQAHAMLNGVGSAGTETTSTVRVIRLPRIGAPAVVG